MLRLGGVRRDSAGTAYLGFGRSYTYYSTSKWMGNLFIYVPEAALYSAVKGAVAEDGQALVLDGSGQVLACADKSRVGAMLFDDYPLEGEGFRYHEQTYRGKPSIFAVKDIAGVRDILGGSLCTMTIRPEESLYRGLQPVDPHYCGSRGGGDPDRAAAVLADFPPGGDACSSAAG